MINIELITTTSVASSIAIEVAKSIHGEIKNIKLFSFIVSCVIAILVYMYEVVNGIIPFSADIQNIYNIFIFMLLCGAGSQVSYDKIIKLLKG